MTIIEPKKTQLPLKLDLQFFAQDPPPADPPGTDPQDPPADPPKPEPKFTQEDLDRIVKERLARAKQKADEEAERKRLEEENKFKELYDKTKADLDEIQTQLKQREVKDAQTAAILAAGYTAEQVEGVRRFLTGETADEFTAGIEEAKKFIPVGVQGADPSPGNPPRVDPQPKNDEEYGRSMFARLRGKK